MPAYVPSILFISDGQNSSVWDFKAIPSREGVFSRGIFLLVFSIIELLYFLAVRRRFRYYLADSRTSSQHFQNLPNSIVLLFYAEQDRTGSLEPTFGIRRKGMASPVLCAREMRTTSHRLAGVESCYSRYGQERRIFRMAVWNCHLGSLCGNLRRGNGGREGGVPGCLLPGLGNTGPDMSKKHLDWLKLNS